MAMSRTTPCWSPNGHATGKIGFAGDIHECNRNPQSEGLLADKSLDKDTEIAVQEATDDLGTAGIRERKKSEPVRSACLQCRKRKIKCSGKRPVCRSCKSVDTECRWEVPEGLTRIEGLKQKLQSVMNRVDDSESLVGGMRGGSDEEATMLLARLRLGDSVAELAHVVRTRQVHLENGYERPTPGFWPTHASEMRKGMKTFEAGYCIERK